MVRLAKTYNEGQDFIIEVEVKALTESIAKKRGKAYIARKFPLKANNIKKTETMNFGDTLYGIATNYRVIVTIGAGE